MANFHKLYTQLFDLFGFPLSSSHRIDKQLLIKAENRLGITIPESLRAYYEIAGKERRFNHCYQRFLSPSMWFVDQKHLVFLDENQSVCCWGVSVKTPRTKDPGISQGVENDEQYCWYSEKQKCSKFITVSLHYQAVSGGFKHCGGGAAPDDAYERLKKDGWKYAGEVDELWAFHRQNQVVCFMPSELPFMPPMMVLAGGKTAADLRAISESLSVELS